MTDPEKVESATGPRKPSGKKLVLLLTVVGIIALIVLGAFGARYYIWWTTSNKSIESAAAGDFPKAVAEGKAALEVMSFLPDPKASESTLRTLSSIYACRRNFAAALTYNYQLQELAKKTWGPESAEYALAVCELANIFLEQQKFRQAGMLYANVIGIYKKLPGHEIDTARTLALYAWALCKQNKWEEALAAINQSDEMMRKIVPESSYERLPAIIEGAYISKALGKTTEFYADLASAYKICTEPQDLEKSSHQTAVVLNLLAQLLDEAMEEEHSAKVYSLAVKNCESSSFGGQYNIFMCDILDLQAKQLRKINKVPQAEFAEARSKQVREVKEPN